MNKWTRANPLMSVPGYNVPRGHFANGYTNGGDRVGFKRGGSAQQKLIKGKQERAAKEKDRHQRALEWRKKNAGDQFKKGGWIQDVNKSIKKRGTKGKCTPITKKGCTGRAKALAKTFKKMGRARKGK